MAPEMRCPEAAWVPAQRREWRSVSKRARRQRVGLWASLEMRPPELLEERPGWGRALRRVLQWPALLLGRRAPQLPRAPDGQEATPARFGRLPERRAQALPTGAYRQKERLALAAHSPEAPRMGEPQPGSRRARMRAWASGVPRRGRQRAARAPSAWQPGLPPARTWAPYPATGHWDSSSVFPPQAPRGFAGRVVGSWPAYSMTEQRGRGRIVRVDRDPLDTLWRRPAHPTAWPIRRLDCLGARSAPERSPGRPRRRSFEGPPHRVRSPEAGNR